MRLRLTVSIVAAVLPLAAQAPATAPAPTPPPAAIRQLAAEASRTRESGKVDEAAKLYQKAVGIAPKWAEGWWYLGVLHYDQDRYGPCRDSLRRFIALESGSSPGHALLGLCEFNLRELKPSLVHLEKAFSLGLPNDEQLSSIVMYNIALLQVKAENYERALQLARVLVRRSLSISRENIVIVAGIAAIRKPVFPQELPVEDRELVIKLGNAMVAPGDKTVDEVGRLFEELVGAYPNTPNVHYSYATMLLTNDPDKGLDELKKELAIDAGHLPALVSIVFEYLKRGDANSAKPYAEKAVEVAPGSFTARASLGRTLLELDDIPGAIRELEMSVKLAPESPQTHLSLASAYAKAGRKEDAARERGEFSRLRQMIRADLRDVK